MADPQFWQDLEAEFRALDPYGIMSAAWQHTSGTPGTSCWTLCSGANQTLELRFERLARKAAHSIGVPFGRDSLWAWLDLLKERTLHFRHEPGYGMEINDDGTKHIIITGSVYRVCQASADLCIQLQIAAAEAERQSEANPSPQEPQTEKRLEAREEIESPRPASRERNEPNGPDAGPAGNEVDRRAAVDAYIEEVEKLTGKRITRTDIWKYARYQSRTEFERWERNAPRATKTAHERFTKILSEKPHLKVAPKPFFHARNAFPRIAPR